MVGDPHPQRHVGLLPAEVDQGGGHDVLDPRPRVAPSDAHLRRLHAAGAKVEWWMEICKEVTFEIPPNRIHINYDKIYF